MINVRQQIVANDFILIFTTNSPDIFWLTDVSSCGTTAGVLVLENDFMPDPSNNIGWTTADDGILRGRNFCKGNNLGSYLRYIPPSYSREAKIPNVVTPKKSCEVDGLYLVSRQQTNMLIEHLRSTNSFYFDQLQAEQTEKEKDQ